jgi:hypothetical protein
MARDIIISWGPNQDLLRRLHRSGARYMVIGSTAAKYHVAEWPEPNDLDLVIEPTEETGQKVIDAMEAILGRPLPFNAQALAGPGKQARDKTVMNVDVLTPIPGFEFALHWAVAEDVPMAHASYPVVVRVASVPTLIAWKRLALYREPKRADAIERDIERLEEAARNAQKP